MKPKYKTLLSNTFLFSISSIGTRFLIFLLVPLYTYTLSRGEYGTIDLVVTTSSLLIPFITLSIQDAILRYGLDKKSDTNSIIKSALIITFLGTLLLFLLIPLFNKLPYLSGNVNFLIIITVLYSYRTVMSTYLKAINKIKIFVADSILFTLLLAISNILFLAVYQLGIEGYFYSMILSSFISLVFIIIYGKVFNSIQIGHFNLRLTKAMILFSTPMILNSVAWWINSYLDRFFLEYFLGADFVGLYSIAYKIPSMMTAVTAVFIQAWSISAITEYSQEEKKFFSNVLKYLILSLFSLSIILITLSKFIMSIYVSPEFFASWRYIPFLVVGSVFLTLSNFFGSIFIASKKSGEVMLTTFYSAVVNILLNYLLIPKFGIQGAVLATMISYFTVYIARVIMSRKIFKFNIDYKRTFVVMGLIISQSILITFELFSDLVTIITMIGSFIVVIYIYKNILNELIHLIKNKTNKGENNE